MSLVATCACGKSFQAKPELAGKRVQCPACGGVIAVPAAAAPAAAAADPLGLDNWSPAQAAPAPLAQPAASPLLAAPTYAARATTSAGVPRWVYVALGIGGGVIVLGIVAWLGVSAILSAVRGTPETAQKTEAPPPQPPAPPAPAKPVDTRITNPSAAGGYSVHPNQLTETGSTQPANPPADMNLADLLNLSPDGKTPSRPLRQLAQMTEDDRKAAYRLIVMQEKLYRRLSAGAEGMAKTGDKQIDDQMQGHLKTMEDSVWNQIGRLVNLSKEDAQAIKKQGDEKQWPSGL